MNWLFLGLRFLSPAQSCAVRVRAAAVAAALAAAVLARAAHAAPPREVVLEYELLRNGAVLAEVTERLTHDGRRYRIDMEGRGRGVLALSSRGALKRSSEGLIGADGLRPVEFRDQRGNRTPETASFDWAGGRVRTVRDGQTSEHRLVAPAQDKLSFPWSFAFAPPATSSPGTLPAFILVDGRGAHGERFRVAGRESLEIPAGRFEALRLVKEASGEGDRFTELWLALERHHLPLRILVTEADGTRADQRLVRIGGAQ